MIKNTYQKTQSHTIQHKRQQHMYLYTHHKRTEHQNWHTQNTIIQTQNETSNKHKDNINTTQTKQR